MRSNLRNNSIIYKAIPKLHDNSLLVVMTLEFSHVRYYFNLAYHIWMGIHTIAVDLHATVLINC